MTTIQHAPTPWTVFDEHMRPTSTLDLCGIRDKEGNDVVSGFPYTQALHEALEYIVQAVNAHYVLVEACGLALQYVLAWRSEYQYPEEVNDINKIKQALKLAKGEANSDAMGAN